MMVLDLAGHVKGSQRTAQERSSLFSFYYSTLASFQPFTQIIPYIILYHRIIIMDKLRYTTKKVKIPFAPDQKKTFHPNEIEKTVCGMFVSLFSLTGGRDRLIEFFLWALCVVYVSFGGGTGPLNNLEQMRKGKE